MYNYRHSRGIRISKKSRTKLENQDADVATTPAGPLRHPKSSHTSTLQTSHIFLTISLLPIDQVSSVSATANPSPNFDFH